LSTRGSYQQRKRAKPGDLLKSNALSETWTALHRKLPLSIWSVCNSRPTVFNVTEERFVL